MMVIQDHHSIGYAYFMVTYGILWVISELVLKKARFSVLSGTTLIHFELSCETL